METLTSPSIYDGLHSLECLKQELQQIQNGKLTSKQGNKFAIIEKELKALEIIKIVCNNFPVTIREMIFKSKLSKEEYDLLKEVLL